MKQKPNQPKRKQNLEFGNISRVVDKTLTTYNIGALPILNKIIELSKIEDFLSDRILEDKRCNISNKNIILILFKNFLVAREPIYGVAEWVRQQAPELLNLDPVQIRNFNDDRIGRCLDRLFDVKHSSLVLAITAHVVKEFNISLDELHNDSTTITFHGNYKDAAQETRERGKLTKIITWGNNKDHRPDLKQLLYTLTIESLQIYHEERDCRKPTTRRIIDLFQNIQRHELVVSGSETTRFVTELSSVQEKIRRLLKVPLTDYSK